MENKELLIQYDQEVNRLFQENKKLKEENERLSKNQRYYKNGVFSLEYDKETMSDMIDDYKSRINKAIEYIAENKHEMYSDQVKDLLDILIW